MRDAFGGIFMIRLLLVFVFIFVAFSALALNYAKAFRIKNSIITFVEENEIIDLDSFFSEGSGGNLEKFNNILKKYNYNMECPNGENGLTNKDKVDKQGDKPIYCYKGIVIKESDTSVGNIIHYEITTYVNWNLGSLNMILAVGNKDERSKGTINGAFAIKGEAKVVKRVDQEFYTKERKIDWDTYKAT